MVLRVTKWYFLSLSTNILLKASEGVELTLSIKQTKFPFPEKGSVYQSLTGGVRTSPRKRFVLNNYSPESPGTGAINFMRGILICYLWMHC